MNGNDMDSLDGNTVTASAELRREGIKGTSSDLNGLINNDNEGFVKRGKRESSQTGGSTRTHEPGHQGLLEFEWVAFRRLSRGRLHKL